jgi:hypothetical protein
MKTCAACHMEKALSAFVKGKGRPDGLHPYCKPCQAAKSRDWNERNREGRAVIIRRYYRAHRDVELARIKAWRLANPERYAATSKLWERAHPEAVSAKLKRYDERHPEKVRAKRLRRAAAVRAFRRMIYERDAGLCWLCEVPVAYESMTLDHVIPISKGGADGPENLALAHLSCNDRKGTKLMEKGALKSLPQC